MSFNMFNVVVLFVLVSLCLCDATEIQNVGIWPVKTSADCPVTARMPLQVNDTVVRGPDWKWADKDGNGPGTVIELHEDGWVIVRWNNTGKCSGIRYGADNKYDVQPIIATTTTTADTTANTATTSGQGHFTHGYWKLSDKEGTRCVLVCFNGYEPDNCHVLRKIGPDRWNMEIPQCVKKSWIPSWKTVAKATVVVAAGAGAVAAVPVVLSAVGFTSAGVLAGSIAAGLQGPATAAGGVFAACQSAGAVGLATGTQAGLFSGVSAVTGALTSFFGGVTCEQE